MAVREGPAGNVAAGTSPLTSAVLLAAGKSRRMGRSKALLDWRGLPLIVHQVRMLMQAGVDDVVAVLGHQAQELQSVLAQWELPRAESRVRWVVNEDYRSGKFSSLRAGLRAVRPAVAPYVPGPVLILNVDQPRSAAITTQILRAHAQGVRRRRILFTVPTCDGKGGHPIALERELLQEVLALSPDSMGLRLVRARHWAQVQRVELGHAELLWDLNTPEEYQRVAPDRRRARHDETRAAAKAAGRGPD